MDDPAGASHLPGLPSRHGGRNDEQDGSQMMLFTAFIVGFLLGFVFAGACVIFWAAE